MKFLYSITICYYWDRFGRIQSSNCYPFSYQIDAHRTRHASTCVDAFLAGKLQRRNNIPTLISSGTTHFPFFTLRFPTHSLALQPSSSPLVTPSRSRAPERSPTRHTTTTRSKSGSSSSPSVPGAYSAACSGGAGLTGSCVG